MNLTSDEVGDDLFVGALRKYRVPVLESGVGGYKWDLHFPKRQLVLCLLSYLGSDIAPFFFFSLVRVLGTRRGW